MFRSWRRIVGGFGKHERGDLFLSLKLWWNPHSHHLSADLCMPDLLNHCPHFYLFMGFCIKGMEPYCTKSNLPINSWHQPFDGMRVLMDVNSPWVGISTQEIPKQSVLCKCYPEAQRKETGGASQAIVGEIKRSREGRHFGFVSKSS